MKAIKLMGGNPPSHLAGTIQPLYPMKNKCKRLNSIALKRTQCFASIQKALGHMYSKLVQWGKTKIEYEYNKCT